MTTIKEIKELLATVKELDNPFSLNWKKILVLEFKRKSTSVKKAIQAELDEDLRLETMLSYEKRTV